MIEMMRLAKSKVNYNIDIAVSAHNNDNLILAVSAHHTTAATLCSLEVCMCLAISYDQGSRLFLFWLKINSQSLEDAQAGYTSQNMNTKNLWEKV